MGHVVNILSIVGHKFGPSNSRTKPVIENSFIHSACLFTKKNLSFFFSLFMPQMNGLYPASRHANTAITECLRQEFLYLYENVKITSISPG
jgi:NAD(P)-dependent dehydrogenase (short-subunit alcohol dehydrogenase family)